MFFFSTYFKNEFCSLRYTGVVGGDGYGGDAAGGDGGAIVGGDGG